MRKFPFSKNKDCLQSGWALYYGIYCTAKRIFLYLSSAEDEWGNLKGLHKHAAWWVPMDGAKLILVHNEAQNFSKSYLSFGDL